MRVTRHELVAFVAVCLLAVPSAAESAIIGPGTFDFSGTFTSYNEEVWFELRLDSPMLLEASTSSWIEPDGGFDPVLTLFDSTRQYLVDNDDRDFADRNSLLVLPLLPGIYWLVLTQAINYYEPQFSRFGYSDTGCDSGAFASCDSPFGGFSGNYALQISLTPDQVPVPEPGTLALTGLGLLALARRRLRRPPSG